MAFAYLMSVVVALVVLAVALRRRPVAAPPRVPAPGPGVLPAGAEVEVRMILTAAVQLAARLAPTA